MALFSQTVGWIGMLLIVSAYFLVSHNAFNRKHPTAYQLMNVFGALGIGINVFQQQAWPAFVLQVVWGVVAVTALISQTRKS